MALIKCPKCHQEIPNKATACPHCGTPIVMRYKNSIYAGGIIITFCLISWKYLSLDSDVAVVALIGGTAAIVSGLVGLLKRHG